MARNTDLHNYTVPTTGDTNYDSTFSTYFDEIDTDVPIRDVESNLSNYTPKSGAKFEATDTENVFIGDGSSWNQLATSGKNPTYESVSAEKSLTDPSGTQHTGQLADDGDSQPPESHDNTAHASNYTTTSPSDVDSTNWNDYEIQKNGTDGNGIINFKT